MVVRPAIKEDWDELLRIHKSHGFPFPDFKNMLHVLVIEDKNKIVAWGYVKKYVETVFIPDKNTPKSTIVKSLKLISEKSSEMALSQNIDQVHAYVEDEHFADLLVDRFGYKVCTGIPLVLNLENSNGKER